MCVLFASTVLTLMHLHIMLCTYWKHLALIIFKQQLTNMHSVEQGVTTRARPSMPCGSEDGRSSAGGGVGGGGGGGGGWGMRCPEEPGFYLSPRESCQTYDVFGRLPALHPNNWSVVCLKPGRLTDLFGVSDELRDTATMSIDKSLK